MFWMSCPGEYFTQFHNNAPMYLFLVAFFKLLHLFGVENFMPFALVLNNLLINASLLALYWALRQLYGAKNALFGLMGSFLFLCFLMYGPILYTDTATMPFPILALAIWLRARQLPWGKGAALRCAAVGLLAAVGAWLKLTVAIMLIAILIDMALGAPRGARWKRAGCALAAFAVLYGALSAVTLHTAWLPALVTSTEGNASFLLRNNTRAQQTHAPATQANHMLWILYPKIETVGNIKPSSRKRKAAELYSAAFR